MPSLRDRGDGMCQTEVAQGKEKNLFSNLSSGSEWDLAIWRTKNRRCAVIAEQGKGCATRKPKNGPEEVGSALVDPPLTPGLYAQDGAKNVRHDSRCDSRLACKSSSRPIHQDLTTPASLYGLNSMN